MLITGTTAVFGVIGDPVTHSRSPLLHNAAFAARGIDAVYVAFPVRSGNGAAAVEAARSLGVRGLSVTMPHKDLVAAGVDRRSPAVEALGACNTVVRDGDDLVGHNTDGDGFIASLGAEAGVDVAGLRVVVLGAGGAARAIIDALARHRAGLVTVVNRTLANAERAAALFANGASTSVADAALVSNADLVINATSLGMAGGPAPEAIGLDPAWLRQGQIVADIVYQPTQTPLLRAASTAGAIVVGGLGMLLHQAALQFELWTGTPAPLQVMADALDQSLLEPAKQPIVQKAHRSDRAADWE
ncbi:MAG: shikimate dehydrogenase [Actinomycetota bacterium]|nr:shikimate dehydrogenase [Actinomycetota bacterium]